MSIWTTTTIACDFDRTAEAITPANNASCSAEWKTAGTEAQAIRYARSYGWTVSRSPGLTPGTTHYEARCPRHAHRRSR